MADWLVIGLGNPGLRYDSTRHNAGGRAVSILAKKLAHPLKPARGKLRPGKPPAEIAEIKFAVFRLVLARPTTFMNESGRAASGLLRWFKIQPENMVVVHDDIDLKAGALVIKKGGGSGGHRGIESIGRSTGSVEFYRVRIGVGRPEAGDHDPAEYVLDQMSKSAAEMLAPTEEMAAEAALCLVEKGLDEAVSKYNSRDGRI
ncbi:MAG: aminoacyl-tRNA hydrolase [Actinomycetota bacterium]